MKINVTEIQREIGSSQAFNGELFPEDFSWQDEPVSFKGPLLIEGRISNIGEMLVLNASVKGTVILMCRLCMEGFEHNIDFAFEAKLKRTSMQDDPDYFTYEGYEIELIDIVMEFLILELPARRQCTEDCRGLCPKCGFNLNTQSCECSFNEEEDPDPDLDERLKALKDYFSTQSKEV